MDDSEQYLNSIPSQVDTNIDEVLDHLDSEFRNWEVSINTTFEDAMVNSKLSNTLELSNFVLNALENFFKSNKTQIVNKLNMISKDIQMIKQSADKIEIDAKNLAGMLPCQNIPKCSEAATNPPELAKTLSSINCIAINFVLEMCLKSMVLG